MSQEDFILAIVRCVALVICVGIISIAGCSVNEDYLISHDIAHGAEPFAAHCAHESGTSIACVAATAGRAR